MKHSPPQPFRLSVLCFFLAAATLLADTTVPPTTVTSGQTLNVEDPGIVTTSGSVQIQAGGTAVLRGGTAVKLEPGFHAATGSLFNAMIVFNPASLPDTDADGLGDAWEIQYFGSLTATTGSVDSDNDGLSNLLEFRLQTNPTTGVAGLQSDATNTSTLLKIHRPQ